MLRVTLLYFDWFGNLFEDTSHLLNHYTLLIKIYIIK